MVEIVPEEVFITAESECTACDKQGACVPFKAIVDGYKNSGCGGIFKVMICPLKKP